MNTRAKQSNFKRSEDDNSVSSTATSSDTDEMPTTEEHASTKLQKSQSQSQTQTQPSTSNSNIIVKSSTNVLWVVYDASKIYLLWVLLHFSASQVYVPICSPFSFWGFIITPILAATPQCKALRWIINTGGSTMETMWVILGVWLCSKICIPYTNWPNPMQNQPRISGSSSNRDRARSYDYIHKEKT